MKWKWCKNFMNISVQYLQNLIATLITKIKLVKEMREWMLAAV